MIPGSKHTLFPSSTFPVLYYMYMLVLWLLSFLSTTLSPCSLYHNNCFISNVIVYHMEIKRIFNVPYAILPSFAISNISLAKPAPGTRIDTSFLELQCKCTLAVRLKLKRNTIFRKFKIPQGLFWCYCSFQKYNVTVFIFKCSFSLMFY